MLNNFLRKSVICGIILVFLGVSFSSSIGGTLNDESPNATHTNLSLKDYTLGYWKFDEGAGDTASDSSGHDFDGTIYGASWVTGKYGKALSFDGTNDYVDLDDYSENLGQNKTDDMIYSLWFLTESTEEGLIYCISDKWGVSNPELTIQLCSNGSIRFQIWTLYCGLTLYSDEGHNDGKWHEVEIIFYGSTANPTIEMFIDKDFKDNITDWLCIIYNDEFSLTKIGRRAYDATKHFEGLVDEFKIIKYPQGNKQKHPTIDGPTIGNPYEEYDYTFTIYDPEDDEVSIKIDWGDGDITDWLGPFKSGEVVTVSHEWDEEDAFCIKAKSKDFMGQSGWGGCYEVKIGNQRPDPPITTGPKHGDPQQQYTYTFVANDFDDDDVKYLIDWGDGDTSEIGYHESGEPVTATHSWNTNNDYYIKARATDKNNKVGDWSVYHIRIGDQPPNEPKIYGALRGDPYIKYEYGFMATDPESDNLTYEIDWGDGNIETDIGPFPSGEICPRSHTWNKTGTYSIKARVKDEFDYYSDWSIHEIVVPRPKVVNFHPLKLLFERFPRAFLILRYLLELLKSDIMLLENL